MSKTGSRYRFTTAAILVSLTACSTTPPRVTPTPPEPLGQVQQTVREEGGQTAGAPVPPPVTGAIPSDPKVKKIQKGLNQLGYKCGKADGKRGAKTDACIAKFLRDAGIEETALEEELRKQLSQRPPTGRKEKPPGSSVTPVAVSAPPDSPTPSPLEDVEEWGQ
jgi:peptidoglycan hydrolase-like protein with peptidoglycan-binding domain